MTGRRVLLLQLDGKLPNLALMRIAAHHRQQGDEVMLRAAGNAQAIEPRLDEPEPDRVYASALFTRTRPFCETVERRYPGAEVGGTGYAVGADTRRRRDRPRRRGRLQRLAGLERLARFHPAGMPAAVPVLRGAAQGRRGNGRRRPSPTSGAASRTRDTSCSSTTTSSDSRPGRSGSRSCERATSGCRSTRESTSARSARPKRPRSRRSTTATTTCAYAGCTRRGTTARTGRGSSAA